MGSENVGDKEKIVQIDGGYLCCENCCNEVTLEDLICPYCGVKFKEWYDELSATNE